MRRGLIIGGLWIAAGCTARGPEPLTPEGEAEEEARREGPVVPEAVEREEELPRRSCVATAAASQVGLEHVRAAVTVGERTFALAWRRKQGADVETVVVSIDREGGLSVVPVPVPYADPSTMGGDAGGLTIVYVPLRGTGMMVRAAFAGDGSLRPGQPVALPEVAWGWPGELVADGARAWLVHSLATQGQTLGASVLYSIDLASARVTATAPATGMEVRCDAGVCTRVTLGNGQATVVRLAGEAEKTLAVAVNSECPAVYAVEGKGERVFVMRGDPWRAVRVAEGVEEVTIDGGLAGERACGMALYEFPFAGRPGIIDGTRSRELLRWDGKRRVFGAREMLPDPGFDRTIQVEHADGVIEVGWTSWHGMAHSPSDREVRRYFKHWSFEGGRVSLLRHEQGTWAAVDATPLALADAKGTFHDGYAPVVLRNGLHAAVLLAPDGGAEPAYFQPYLRPCP